MQKTRKLFTNTNLLLTFLDRYFFKAVKNTINQGLISVDVFENYIIYFKVKMNRKEGKNILKILFIICRIIQTKLSDDLYINFVQSWGHIGRM
jgi:hypothetical protein